MSIEDLGIEDGSLGIVKKELDEMFDDVDASREETKGRYRAVKYYCEELIAIIEEEEG